MKKTRLAWILMLAPFAFGDAAKADSSNVATPFERYPGKVGKFRQSGYKLEDPTGDDALYRFMELIPEKLFKIMLGMQDIQDSNQTQEAVTAEQQALLEDECLAKQAPPFEQSEDLRKIQCELKLDGRENPIKRDGFVKMLVEVINQERARGIQPKLGTPHDWSDVFKKYKIDELRKMHYPSRDGGPGPSDEEIADSDFILGRRKLLIALFNGVTSKFMVSGTEKPLQKWIMTQRRDSITLDEMFRQSYRLNQGDLYLTLLTIENVLSERWRAQGRENLPFTQRLKGFTIQHCGDRDKFGTWYHLWGIMLYGYVAGSEAAAKASWLESTGGAILARGDTSSRIQKDWANREGGQIGALLKDQMTSGNYARQPSDPALLSEDSYLRRHGDFRDRLPIQADPNMRVEVSRSSNDMPEVEVELRYDGPKMTGCKVEIMAANGGDFNVLNLRTVEGVDFIPGRRTKVSVWMDVPSSPRVRGFISGCRENPGRQIAFER